MNSENPTSNPGPQTAPKAGALFSAGFRPFFLLAGFYGFFPIFSWLWAYLGDGDVPGYFAPSHWHGHEMVFGFVIAAASGFLLTAVPNWTYSKPFQGAPLAALTLVWLLGRAVMWFGWPLSPLFVAIVDLMMIPTLAVYIGRRLVAHGVRQNYIVLVVLSVLFCANLLMHLEALAILPDSAGLGLNLGVFGVIFLVAMISGRIIPGFTANALRREGINVFTETPMTVTRLVVLSIVLAILFDLFGGDEGTGRLAAGVTAATAALALLIRMRRWKSFMVVRQPIVWILHAGHFWLIVGFALLAASHFSDEISRDAGLHAFTAGAIGTMIIAMVTRVSLGHSGREIKASPAIVVAYFMVILGSILRVIAALAQTLLPGEGYSYLIGAGGLLWAGGFVVFTIVFWPILTRSRL